MIGSHHRFKRDTPKENNPFQVQRRQTMIKRFKIKKQGGDFRVGQRRS